MDDTDVPEEIAAVQPGLGMPAAMKVRRLRSVLETLPGEHCTLVEAAIRLLP